MLSKFRARLVCPQNLTLLGLLNMFTKRSVQVVVTERLFVQLIALNKNKR